MLKTHGPLPSCVSPGDRVVCFDGECSFCNGWVKRIHRNDPRGRIKLAPLQAEAGKAIQAWCGMPRGDMDTMIFVDRGRAHTKSGAALRLVRYLSWPWPLLSALLIVPWFLRDWVYNRIAHNRYRLFGKEDACLVPTPELKKRFLT